MLILLWSLVFLVSLAALIKGAGWLLQSAEKLGLSLGLSPFIIGVIIIGVGTSFPELVSSIVAVAQGVTEMPAANAIGSNIANILLVIAVAAIIGRKLKVTKDLIDIDLPLLATATVLFCGIAWDRQITFFEALLLVTAYAVYILYTVFHKERPDKKSKSSQRLSFHFQSRPKAARQKQARPKLTLKDIALLVVGILGLTLGAKYLIESLVWLSTTLNIAVGVITASVVALGTSLPELIVTAKAALQKKADVAIGNIIGSNVFNVLMVVGVPGLIKTLTLGQETFAIGLPIMLLATFLFIISGISRKVHIWEGAFFVLLYILFITKLFNLF